MGEPAVLTKIIDVHETQMRLEELLAMLFEGTEIILAQNNRPLARLTRVASPTMPRIAGLHSGAVWMSEDFSEPLPEAFWTGNV